MIIRRTPKKPLFLLILAALLSACGGHADKTEHAAAQHAEEPHTGTVELTERQLRTVGIVLGPLEQRNLSEAVRAAGELRLPPQHRASVVPLVGGIVRRITVVEGQHVRQGQVVAYIENADILALQRDYLTAAHELQYARQELERQQLLQREQAGVEKNLQQARATVAVAETRVSALGQQLRQLGIAPGSTRLQRQLAVTAPIRGTVTRIQACTGSYADAQQSMLDIADNRAVYAALRVFEKDLSRVAVGQHVDLALTYQQDTHLSGTVTAVSPSIDAQTRSATVSVRFDAAPSAPLGQGTTVSAMISTARQRTPALPDEAIVRQGGRSFAYVLDHKAKEDGQTVYRFRPVEVVTGQSELGHTAVSFTTVPAAGTQFVRAGAFYIASASTDHGEHSH